ncbi:MAG: DUF480 domain-containing protein [Acidimicrobiales bacterium]|nr:DUF480 domain-containing protein [Acidimicrobiales bacterium]
MELTAVEIRVLGALMEKDRTTPDSYPLTTNALVSACNQKSSREPVMALTATEVDAAMLSLREHGLARTVRGDGHRSFKHRHVADEAWRLDDGELACLAVIMLRGPQSPGELRTRTERYVSFGDNEMAEAALRRLADRPEPLVRNVGRAPGQSQDRWMHLVGDGAPVAKVAPSAPASTPPAAESVPVAPDAGHAPPVDLAAEVAELRTLVERLYAELGIDL